MTKMQYLVRKVTNTTKPDFKKFINSEDKEEDYIFITHYTESRLRAIYKIAEYYVFKDENDFKEYFNVALNNLSVNTFKIISRTQGDMLNTIFDEFTNTKAFYKVFKNAGQCDFINKGDHVIAYSQKERCYKAYIIIGTNFPIESVINVNKNPDFIA